MTFTALGNLGQQFAFASSLGQTPLHTLVHHNDDAADHLEMAKFLGCNIEQHIFTTGVALGERLTEIAHRGGKLPLRSAKLLEKQAAEHRVRFCDSDRVHQPFIVHKHVLRFRLSGRTWFGLIHQPKRRLALVGRVLSSAEYFVGRVLSSAEYFRRQSTLSAEYFR